MKNNIENIKAKILQLAISGKLVEQDPEDEPAEILYEKIQEEKKELIKKNKISKKELNYKRYKNGLVDIPKSWVWTDLGAIITSVNSGSGDWIVSKNMDDDGSIKLLQLGSIGFGKYKNKGFKYITEDMFDELNCKEIHPGDILINRIISDEMSVCIKPNLEGRVITSVDTFYIREKSDIYHNKYLLNLFLSPYFQKEVFEKKTGTTRKRISQNNLKKILIPLPPLNEQKRIVKKVDELFSLIDGMIDLKDGTINIIDLLEEKILDVAIKGKLVGQDSEDESANILYKKIQEQKEKLIKNKKIRRINLSSIKKDEIPFEIPENWKWVKSNEILDIRDGTHDTPKYVDKGIPLITGKNLRGNSIDFENTSKISEEDHKKIMERSYVQKNDLLMAMIGTIGNPVIVDTNKNFSIKNVALYKHYKKDFINPKYLLYYLLYSENDMNKKASGGVQKFMSLTKLRNYLIPLPPLNEQKRIVKELDLIMDYIEKLRINLN